jgi:hypothetical protein
LIFGFGIVPTAWYFTISVHLKSVMIRGVVFGGRGYTRVINSNMKKKFPQYFHFTMIHSNQCV